MPFAVTIEPFASPSVEARAIVLLPVLALAVTPVEPEAEFTIAPENSAGPVPASAKVLLPLALCVRLLVKI